MYLWRKLTEKQRHELLAFRRLNALPWHSPPHRVCQNGRYLLTAACYEHRHIIGQMPERLAEFSERLLKILETHSEEIHAGCVLPNHYHALVFTRKLPELLRDIGLLHGRTAFEWNGEDDRRGRKVWFNCAETGMKSDRHFWGSLNYVHHNPVHHGYVQHWQDWPFSSATEFLEQSGRERTAQIWKAYPICDYGTHWDPPEL